MVPLIAEGLRAVRKVEDFVDATIGEDCSFECKKGKSPAPKPGHVPTSNGNRGLTIFNFKSFSSIKNQSSCTNFLRKIVKLVIYYF